ncbi:hypothetical protein H1164_08355 [Thermoactinomyces daqus]|uniref:Uncharacterized protein n=1 Tax=Thermoactinomyces daqus TaxID=1329516 RepID=A0A7W1XA34_9BACL|nr:hypothetical protein [Thermoactinomyces daqus]MBA4542912.1 hypothetical protein [Thermoactinomyces daqus]
MYILQIYLHGEWQDWDEFEEIENAKIAESNLKEDYKHLQTRIMKEEMEDGEVGGFVLTKITLDEIVYYAGIDERTLQVIYSFNANEAIVFTSDEEAMKFVAKLKEVFPYEQGMWIAQLKGELK